MRRRNHWLHNYHHCFETLTEFRPTNEINSNGVWWVCFLIEQFVEPHNAYNWSANIVRSVITTRRFDTSPSLLHLVQQLNYCQLKCVANLIQHINLMFKIKWQHLLDYRYSVYARPFALSGRFYFIDFGIDLPTCRTISWLSSITTGRFVLDAMFPMYFRRQGL